MSAAKLQPAIFGGLLMGVLSALPIVQFGNVCCCLWVICGGVLAAYLMQQGHPYAITIADGALVGLLAGAFGGILTVVLSVPIQMMMAPLQQRFLERFLEGAADLPIETRDLIGQLSSPANPIVLAIRLVFAVIIGMVFSLIGGIIGAAIFKKGAPPTGTVDVLPPQP
jgi:hypothetical protein